MFRKLALDITIYISLLNISTFSTMLEIQNEFFFSSMLEREREQGRQEGREREIVREQSTVCEPALYGRENSLQLWDYGALVLKIETYFNSKKAIYLKIIFMSF